SRHFDSGYHATAPRAVGKPEGSQVHKPPGRSTSKSPVIRQLSDGHFSNLSMSGKKIRAISETGKKCDTAFGLSRKALPPYRARAVYTFGGFQSRKEDLQRN